MDELAEEVGCHPRSVVHWAAKARAAMDNPPALPPPGRRGHPPALKAVVNDELARAPATEVAARHGLSPETVRRWSTNRA